MAHIERRRESDPLGRAVHEANVPGIQVTTGRLLRSRDYLVLVPLSVLLLSPFGFQILNYHGHYIAEGGVVLLLELMLVFNPRYLGGIKRCILSSRGFVLMSTLNIVALCIGGLRFQELAYSYADFRAVETFIVAFVWAQTIDFREKSRALATASFLLYAASILAVLYQVLNASGVKENYPVLAPAMLVFLAVREGRPYQFAAGAAIGIYMALTSFYRSDWVIIGLAIGIALLIGMLGPQRRKFVPLAALVAVLGVITFGALAGDIHAYFTSSTSRYIQSIGKARNLINFVRTGNSGSGSLHIRVLYYRFLAQYWVRLLLPHGLGHLAVYGRISSFFSERSGIPANTIDSGFFFWIWSFGYLLSIPPAIAAFQRVRAVLAFTVASDRLIVVCLLSLFAMYLLVTGSVFSVIPTAFVGGTFLGICLPRTGRRTRARTVFPS